MKFELLLVIIILIAIAIICLFFSIWKVFITKKQITFSAYDVWYAMILGILAGATANVYIMIAAAAIIAIWFTIIGIKSEKNRKEKEKLNMVK